MKRKRRSNSDKMEEMAFIKATTKLRSEVQYLEQNKVYIAELSFHQEVSLLTSSDNSNYFVTLKTRSRRRALSAERPKDPALSLMLTQTISPMEPRITMQSNRLKEEEK